MRRKRKSADGGREEGIGGIGMASERACGRGESSSRGES